MSSYRRSELDLTLATVLGCARMVGWFIVRGLVAAGSSWCPAGAARHRAMRHPPRPAVADELRIRREAIRGLRAIDAYLDAHLRAR